MLRCGRLRTACDADEKRNHIIDINTADDVVVLILFCSVFFFVCLPKASVYVVYVRRTRIVDNNVYIGKENVNDMPFGH